MGGVDAGGKTFSFEILRKYAVYGHYKKVDITIEPGKTEGTMDVPVEEGTYVVEQTSHATIDGYDWKNASHQPGNIMESSELDVYAGKTKSVAVHNSYEIAVTKEITELPITVTGYALGAKVSDINASTGQMRVDIPKVTVKQRNASGGWDDLAPDATIQENIQYAVEILVNAKHGYTYTGLTGDNVTVNGAKADTFDSPWSGTPTANMRVFHELEVLQVVKPVKSIKITTQPTKTTYTAGEKFDPTGMVVTAVYDDNSEAVLAENDYTIFYGDKLTQGQTDVRIQYIDGSGNSGIYVDLPITVKPYVGPHTHTYDDSWYEDGTSHWHECTNADCPDRHESIKDKAAHTFGEWTIVTPATETADGLRKRTCSVCGHEETQVIPAAGHTHTATLVTGKAATCTADGWKDYYKCSCGKFFEDAACTKEISDLDAWKTTDGQGKISAIGHDWGKWTKVDSSKHQRFCKNDANHVEIEDHNFSDRTCTKCGYTKPSSSSGGGGSFRSKGGPGYTTWILDDIGWWLKYADGSYAKGSITTDAAGKQIEIPHWEFINGKWFAFGASGYIITGWLYDPEYKHWFYIDVNRGMLTGWQLLNNKWYYFNPVSDGTRGRLFVNTTTPDGYKVGADGAWIQ